MSFLTAVTRYQNEKTMQNTQKSDSTGIAMYNNSDSRQNLSFSGKFGVDKIQLFFPEGNFSMPSGRPKEFSRLTTETNEGKVTEKYFLNNETFNCDISPNKQTGDLQFGLHFNPSKKLHPYELTKDSNIIYEHTKEIQKELLKSNIEINLDEALVTRFDLAHNIILNNPLTAYDRVFDSFRGLRQIRKQHDDTRLWSNKQNQFIVYDKVKELQLPNLPTNMVRGEMRILKSACMKSTFKTNKLIHLLNQEQGMDYKSVFNNYIETKLFRNTTKQLKFEFKELESMFLDFIYMEGKTIGYNNFLKTLGIQNLHENENSIQSLNEIIKTHLPIRMAQRKTKEINDLLDRFRVIEEKNKPNAPSYIELNQEFRSKIKVA
jgi:hypothetical protein